MTDRVKKADIHAAFNSLCQTATRLGFDVKSWALLESDISTPWELVKKEFSDVKGSRIDSTEFPRYLGNTARQAYETLVSYSRALHAVEILRQNDNSLPTLVQRYPNDKWRWIVGGRYGRSYCDLNRIPSSGTADHATYGDSVECGTRTRARETCMQLNESLRMGGMLGEKQDGTE